jgi:hypothetical protein
MEDRKRSAAQDDFAPPTKRQAVNGSKTSADSDLPWAKDLEVSQCHTTSKHIPSFSPLLSRVPSKPLLCWMIESLESLDASPR